MNSLRAMEPVVRSAEPAEGPVEDIEANGPISPRMALASVCSILVEENAVADVSVNAVTRRQAEWDRQLESVDQKQAELLTIQWKLVREQTGTLARELALVQQQLKDLKVDSRRALLEVERYFRENESKINEERGLRLAMYESLEQRLKKVKYDVEAEAKHRAAADAEVLPKLEALSEALDTRFREHLAMEADLRKLREAFHLTVQESDSLKDSIEQETRERRAVEESMTEMLRELRDGLVREIRDRTSADEDIAATLRASIEQEKSERNASLSSLRTQFTVFQKDLLPQKDELPAVRSRLQELEAMLHARLKDTQRILERESGDRSAGHQKLERRLLEITQSIEKESAARVAQQDETDQLLKNFRTKVKQMVADHAEAARSARDELQRKLGEQLDREIAAREALQIGLGDQIAGQRAALDLRLDALEGCFRDIEQRHRDQLTAEYREWEVCNLKSYEETSRQIRELRDLFQSRLSEERATRESQDAGLEEQLESQDRFLQDIRELFLQRGPRTRQLTARKASPSSTMSPPSRLTSTRPPSPSPHRS